jgi:hypothetical protein
MKTRDCVSPYIVHDDFYEAESGFELFVGKHGQHQWKRVLAGAWGAVLMEDDAVSVVLFASFDKSDVEKFVKSYVPVDPESCARCYRSFIPTDDGGLCASCKR